MWRDDDELFRLMRERLFTAVVGDILDSHGRRRQFLPREIQPLRDDMIVAGRAMPVLNTDLAGDDENPFGLMFEALDDLKRDEVYLVSGGSYEYAYWGELMSTRALKLGAAGAVMNGCSRDTPGILALSFATFSVGRFAQDQRTRGKVVDWRIPIEIGGVRVAPGDIVFGDLDGVVVIPREIEGDVLTEALEKIAAENQVRSAIEGGMSTVEAFRRFGVM